MASYLLYIVTGVVLALMAARHLFVHVSAVRHIRTPGHQPILHHTHDDAMHWLEAALCAGLLIFGLWLALAAALKAASLFNLG